MRLSRVVFPSAFLALPLVALPLVVCAQPAAEDYQAQKLNASLTEIDACNKQLQTLFEQALKDVREMVKTTKPSAEADAQKQVEAGLKSSVGPVLTGIEVTAVLSMLTVLEKAITNAQDPVLALAEARFAEYFKCTPQEINDLYVGKGVPLSVIATGMSIAKATNTPSASLFEQRAAGKSWVEIATEAKLQFGQLQQVLKEFMNPPQ